MIQRGDYNKFPDYVETSPVVMYGTQDITKECTFQVIKSEYVQGTWDNTKKVYTVTGLTADEGWVDIRATYLTGASPVVKRFNLVKQYAGKTGEQGDIGPAGKPGADGIGIKGISEKYAISSLQYSRANHMAGYAAKNDCHKPLPLEL